MTAEANKAITPRATRSFRIMKNGTEEIFPGAGSRLRFANRDVDTLTLNDLPDGLLGRGDAVRVEYGGSGKWVTVFQGDVDRIVDTRGRGEERVQTVTVSGPWGRMNRLVYRQMWTMGPAVSFSSSRVVLGQTASGLRQTMAEQLAEILGFAAVKCGFTVGRIDALNQFLPLDETRGITCADAIRRELRFFPRRIVRFDYSSGNPEIQIVEPSSEPASYVSGIPKSSRVYEYTAHPVSSVDVAVDATDLVVGSANLTGHQVYPEGADTEDLDCLHVTVPLSPGRASTSFESFQSETEDIPGNLNDRDWWKRKHPRLANVAASAIEIDSASRIPASYKRIAKSTKGEIEAAGLHCEVSRFSCTCRIKTAEDEEEDIRLTMDFLTTDAETRTYTWQTGSSAEAGETLPDGLAEALYRQRAQDLINERMTVRLGKVFPKLGDVADGLYLQSFDVDLYDLTAQLSFGQPEHLSAEDMRSLLNGFRQRGFAGTAKLRAGDDGDGEGDATVSGGIPPVSSSEWSPGRKVKTTIRSGDGSTIMIDSSDVSGETAKFRTVTIYDKDGKPSNLKVLATPKKDGEGAIDPENDETDGDPHGNEDQHGDDRDPCNPGSTQSSGGGGTVGGGGNIGSAGGSAGVSATSTPGGGGVSAGRYPSDSASVPPSPSSPAVPGCC